MFLYYWILAYVYDSYGVVHTVCKAHNYYIPNYIPQWILLFPHIGPGLLHRSPELARRCWDRYSKGPSTSAADIKHQETADDRCWNKQESLDLLFRAPKKPSDVDIILTTVLVCFGGNAINTNRYVSNIWFVLVCCCILFFEIHLLSQASCEPFAFVGLHWSHVTFWILPATRWKYSNIVMSSCHLETKWFSKTLPSCICWIQKIYSEYLQYIHVYTYYIVIFEWWCNVLYIYYVILAYMLNELPILYPFVSSYVSKIGCDFTKPEARWQFRDMARWEEEKRKAPPSALWKQRNTGPWFIWWLDMWIIESCISFC